MADQSNMPTNIYPAGMSVATPKAPTGIESNWSRAIAGQPVTVAPAASSAVPSWSWGMPARSSSAGYANPFAVTPAPATPAPTSQPQAAPKTAATATPTPTPTPTSAAPTAPVAAPSHTALQGIYGDPGSATTAVMRMVSSGALSGGIPSAASTGAAGEPPLPPSMVASTTPLPSGGLSSAPGASSTVAPSGVPEIIRGTPGAGMSALQAIQAASPTGTATVAKNAGLADPAAAIREGYAQQLQYGHNMMQTLMSLASVGNPLNYSRRFDALSGALAAAVGANNFGGVQGQGANSLNEAVTSGRNAVTGAGAEMYGADRGLQGTQYRSNADLSSTGITADTNSDVERNRPVVAGVEPMPIPDGKGGMTYLPGVNKEIYTTENLGGQSISSDPTNLPFLQAARLIRLSNPALSDAQALAVAKGQLGGAK